MNEAASRLQRLALLYAFTFFMAAFFPNFLFAETRAMLVSGPIHWVPGVISIVVALAVAAVLRFGRLQAPAVTAVALVFEVASSYGIACAEFVHPGVFGVPAAWVGLSWVAVWILIFNIVVPTVPRYDMAALVSITAVPPW
jgi:hypothetical protein